MSNCNGGGGRRALVLYKSILRAHERYLPSQSMRQLGDAYVKSEFRLHKTAKPEQANLFFVEWEKYLRHIEQTGREKLSIEMGLVNPRSRPLKQQLQQQQLGIAHGGLMSSSPSSFLQQDSISKQIRSNDHDGDDDYDGGSTIYFGKDISNDIVLSEEQLSKLDQLRDEANKAAAATAVNDNGGNGNGRGERR